MSETPLNPREKIASTNAYNQSARRWLTTGVGFFLIIMLCLWGYATFTELSFFDWGHTAEAKLLSQTRSEFDNLSKDNPLLNGKIKERIEEAKREAKSYQASTTVHTATTTTVTTTIEMNTSTIEQ